jgi:iron complex transport system ATP-binding protein
MPALRIENLSAGYAGRKIVEGVNLRLEPGGICGIIGPNGAGKSTLLKAILGLGVEVTGSIIICGSDSRTLSSIERAKLVSFLPQDYNPSSRLTAMETVLLGRHPHRSAWAGDSKADVDIAIAAMETTGIGELRERVFAELSGGEKRLVLLASALAQEPRLLLLDEPGSALDFRHQIGLWLLLEKLARQGIAILVSTHEVNVASGFMTSVMVLGSGSCIASGPPEEVFRSALLSSVFDVPLEVSRDETSGSWVVLPRFGSQSEDA